MLMESSDLRGLVAEQNAAPGDLQELVTGKQTDTCEPLFGVLNFRAQAYN